MAFIIIAPHADDEIIGCFEILKYRKGQIKTVLFPTEEILAEASKSSEMMGFDRGVVSYLDTILYPSDILVCPDPSFELHPEHRRWGAIGENYARMGRCSILFYTTNMNAPYIREVKETKEKERILTQSYPGKESLWHTDHKYFLFEGQTQWVISWGV